MENEMNLIQYDRELVKKTENLHDANIKLTDKELSFKLLSKELIGLKHSMVNKQGK